MGRADDYKVVHALDLDKKTVLEAEKVVLCGTALKNDKYFGFVDRFGWVRDEKLVKPVLGICAGMQVVGILFNAKLIKRKEIGMTKIFVRRKNRIFGDKKVFHAYELHKYAISKPEQFLILAESEKCIQAIKHEKKPIYGVLFHPEVRNREIITNFLGL
ncbi:MAG: hypothetical protein DRO11_07925 [Methanobacteriota archaeon]|nr:MAG: hypothetical protein DRO11_07925 [Euryarchaeota archaeon]